MKYSLLPFLFLFSCENTPVNFQAEIVRKEIKYYRGSKCYSLTIFSNDYGSFQLSESPYYEKVNLGDTVSVSCNNRKYIGLGPCYIKPLETK